MRKLIYKKEETRITHPHAAMPSCFSAVLSVRWSHVPFLASRHTLFFLSLFLIWWFYSYLWAITNLKTCILIVICQPPVQQCFNYLIQSSWRCLTFLQIKGPINQNRPFIYMYTKISHNSIVLRNDLKKGK